MSAFTQFVFKLEISTNFSAFVFFSTLASYSVHWYLTDAATEIFSSRAPWLSANKRVHFIFFVLSTLGSSYFLFAEKQFFVWILPAVFLTLLYTAPKLPFPLFHSLKKHIWGKTFLLAAMWTYVTAILPLLIEEGNWHTQHWIFCINRFTLIFAICILFDIRDKEHDKITGVKSVVTILNTPQLKKIFTISLLLCIISTILLYIHFQDIWLTTILLLPAFLTYFLFNPAVKTTNDYLFYFILDGLMALSPILYFIEKLLSP